jgi:hypothetical protein
VWLGLGAFFVLGTIWNFVRDNFDIAGTVAAVVASIQHSRSQSPSRAELVVVWTMIVGALFYFVSFLVVPQTITLRGMVVVSVCYAAALYALICDGLRFGEAARLTKKRGAKWIKELDYVYLSLGALGIIGSINRLPAMGGPYPT